MKACCGLPRRGTPACSPTTSSHTRSATAIGRITASGSPPTGPRRSAGHEEMNQRAIACFGDALVDARLAANEPLREALLRYFAWATTTTMGRYRESAADVPEVMSIPKWSWEGPTA